MIYTPVFLLNGALCLGAALFASFAKGGRREAFWCASALGINFLFCALVFTPLSPAIVFGSTIKETWMAADTMLGAACVLMAYRYWWGYAMCALAIIQVGLHGAMIEHVIDGSTYSENLDIVLHAQVAVFFLIGGRGIGDLLRNSLVLRSLPRLHAASRFVKEADK